MKIQEIVANGSYVVFARMGQENRDKHIKAIEYIQHLASSTGTDISNWDIFEVFGRGSGNLLYLRRQEINRRFLQKAREQDEQGSSSEDSGVNVSEVQAQINDACRRAVMDRIRQYEYERQNYLREGHRYYERYLSYVSQAAERHRTIMSLGGEGNNNVGEQVQRIVDAGFWVFDGVENNTLKFHTAGNVVCQHRNRDAGINIQVDLGKFKSWIDVPAGRIGVDEYEGNTRVNGGDVIHPHVLRGGNICWGNSGSTAGELLATMKYDDLMALLANLLSDYNDGNPYASLNVFLIQQTVNRAERALDGGASDDDVKQIFEFAGLSDEYREYVSGALRDRGIRMNRRRRTTSGFNIQEYLNFDPGHTSSREVVVTADSAVRNGCYDYDQLYQIFEHANRTRLFRLYRDGEARNQTMTVDERNEMMVRNRRQFEQQNNQDTQQSTNSFDIYEYLRTIDPYLDLAETVRAADEAVRRGCSNYDDINSIFDHTGHTRYFGDYVDGMLPSNMFVIHPGDRANMMNRNRELLSNQQGSSGTTGSFDITPYLSFDRRLMSLTDVCRHADRAVQAGCHDYDQLNQIFEHAERGYQFPAYVEGDRIGDLSVEERDAMMERNRSANTDITFTINDPSSIINSNSDIDSESSS